MRRPLIRMLLHKLIISKINVDIHNTLKALRLLIYGLHSSMNYLSLLLFGPCLCFIIYLMKHKVYCIYKYTAGLVGMDCNRGKGCAHKPVLSRYCKLIRRQLCYYDKLESVQQTDGWCKGRKCRSGRWKQNVQHHLCLEDEP